MNPLPQVIMMALSICAQHKVQMSPTDQCTVLTFATGANSSGYYYEPGYEACADIVAKADAVQQAAADKILRDVAKKDQPKLQAALKALESMK